MDTIVREIGRAMQSKSYYLGIMLALAIPDICAALESNDGRAGGKKPYEAWYNRHLADKFILTGSDCYSLRCGVLHQSRAALVKKGASYRRVVFTLPNPQMVSVHNCIMNDALVLDAFRFCMDVTTATRKWYTRAQHTANVKRNYKNLLRYRENGLFPYTAGIPVIA